MPANEQLTEIQGVARFRFHEGKVEEFKRLCAEFMDIVRAKDTGTLQFEVYLTDDESEYVIHERYGTPRRSSPTVHTSATSCRRFLRQDRVPARSLATRAPSSPQ
jgi:quinol monooxygenase YgiN